MKKLTLALYGILALQLMSCAFDRKDVRDEQDQTVNEEKSRKDEEIIAISGTYEGYLTINEKPYEIIMTVSLEPNSDPKSTDSLVTARVKRTDTILPYDSYLSGTYIPHGALQLRNLKSSVSIYETSSIYARAQGDHLLGNLSQAGGVLGTFDVTRSNRSPNLDLIGPCDSFYKTVRTKVEQLTGTYEFTRRPIGWAPYTTDLNIQSFRNLSMKAVHSDAKAGLSSTLDVIYVSYVGRGLLYLNTASGSTEKEILSVELERQEGQPVLLKGNFSTNTGRQGTAVIEKTSDAPSYCPAEPKKPSKN